MAFSFYGMTKQFAGKSFNSWRAQCKIHPKLQIDTLLITHSGISDTTNSTELRGSAAERARGKHGGILSASFNN